MKKEISKIDFKNLLFENKTEIVFILGAVLIGIFYDWTNMEILIFTFFIFSILRPISTRFFAGIALFFLILTPILLLLERQDRAEEFAVYAYYFLAISVIAGFFEVKRNRKIEKEIIKKPLD